MVTGDCLYLIQDRNSVKEKNEMSRGIYTVMYDLGARDFTSFAKARKWAKDMTLAHGSAIMYNDMKRLRKLERDKTNPRRVIETKLG